MSIVTETQEVLPAGTWQLDPTHSQIGFAVEYMVGTFRGGFSPIEATLDVGEDGEATLAGSAHVKGVKVQDENLSAHLLLPEFFDVERTPHVSFRSTEIDRFGDEVAIAGELTIKGVAEPVELKGAIGEPITDPYGRERVGLRLTGTVDRTRFGLNWNVPLPNGKPALASEVTLSAELYLVKA